MALLKVLEQNKTLVKLSLENNKFFISRGLLALIGNVFIFRNRTLRELIMTCYGKAILRKEIEEGEPFDTEMMEMFAQ